MNINSNVTTKRIYCTPAIDTISLDNEISLVLASPFSTPPPEGNPGETKNNSTPEYFSNNPYSKYA